MVIIQHISTQSAIELGTDLSKGVREEKCNILIFAGMVLTGRKHQHIFLHTISCTNNIMNRYRSSWRVKLLSSKITRNNIQNIAPLIHKLRNNKEALVTVRFAKPHWARERCSRQTKNYLYNDQIMEFLPCENYFDFFG